MVPQNSGEPLGARARLLRTGCFSSQFLDQHGGEMGYREWGVPKW